MESGEATESIRLGTRRVAARRPGAARRVSRPRVLVADDEHSITALVSEVLTHAGFDVLRAHGGEAALTLTRAMRPDLVLLDVVMTDMDGRDACRALKADPALSGMPVVLFSSAEEEDVEWEDSGADGFLQKPFDVRGLREFILRVLG